MKSKLFSYLVGLTVAAITMSSAPKAQAVITYALQFQTDTKSININTQSFTHSGITTYFWVNGQLEHSGAAAAANGDTVSGWLYTSTGQARFGYFYVWKFDAGTWTEILTEELFWPADTLPHSITIDFNSSTGALSWH